MSGNKVLKQLHVARDVLGMSHAIAIGLKQFRFGIAEKLAQRIVCSEPAAVERRHGDPDRGILKSTTELALTLGQLLLHLVRVAAQLSHPDGGTNGWGKPDELLAGN